MHGVDWNVVVATASDAIVVFDAAGAACGANPAFYRAFGYAEDALPPLEQLFPDLTGETAQFFVEQLGDWRGGARVAEVELWARAAGGELLPVAVALSACTQAEQSRLVFSLRDMRLRRQTEEALHLRTRALEACGDGVVVVSVTTEAAALAYINPAFSRISGYAPAQALAAGFQRLFADRRDAQLGALLARAIGTGQPMRCELHCSRPDGTDYWCDFNGAPLRNAAGSVSHYVAVIADISDRVAAQRWVLRRNAQLDAVFSLSDDGFVVFDANGRVSLVNGAFERMTGWLAADLMGATLDDLDARFAAASLPGSACAPLARCGEGDLVTLAEPLRQLARKLARADSDRGEQVAYFRDVTRERELERAKQQFLAGAAHQLRTPIQSVLGYAELLTRRSFAPERQAAALANIYADALRLRRIVGELLDLAELDASGGGGAPLTVTDAEPLAQECLAQRRVREPLRALRLQRLGELPPVRIRAAWLDKALSHLLDNACEFSAPDAPIDVLLAPDADTGGVRLQVCDRGVGMSAAELARAGERFWGADAAGQHLGAGLGLALVRALMARCGGRLVLESRPGQGTTATLLLPGPSAVDPRQVQDACHLTETFIARLMR